MRIFPHNGSFTSSWPISTPASLNVKRGEAWWSPGRRAWGAGRAMRSSAIPQGRWQRFTSRLFEKISAGRGPRRFPRFDLRIRFHVGRGVGAISQSGHALSAMVSLLGPPSRDMPIECAPRDIQCAGGPPPRCLGLLKRRISGSTATKIIPRMRKVSRKDKIDACCCTIPNRAPYASRVAV